MSAIYFNKTDGQLCNSQYVLLYKPHVRVCSGTWSGRGGGQRAPASCICECRCSRCRGCGQAESSASVWFRGGSTWGFVPGGGVMHLWHLRPGTIRARSCWGSTVALQGGAGGSGRNGGTGLTWGWNQSLKHIQITRIVKHLNVCAHSAFFFFFF